MTQLFARIQALLASYPHLRRLRVAYSGGVDSHVLLHLLATHRSALGGLPVTAVYVNHGLHPQSRHWALHCRKICQALAVGFSELRVDARPAGEGPEAAARRARYLALGALLSETDALLTAHHRDDQAETLLLQLLRGAGPHGLAAMPSDAPLGRGCLLRPLLETERAEILAYAEFHRLVWIEDSSNLDRRLDRNYLRHEILPRLRARWPKTARSLARSAALCAETAELLDAQADQDLSEAATERPDCLAIPALQALDELRQRNALRRWCRRLRLPLPGTRHLHHILHDALSALRDRQPVIHWPGGEVRRYRDCLYAMPPQSPHDPGQIVPWPSSHSSLSIPPLGHLSLRPVQGSGMREAVLAGQPLTVQFRRGGERFRPAGRRHSRELKKLLQESGVPPWERDRIPLLYAGEQLAAVADLWVADDLTARAEERGLILEWQK